MQGFLNSRSRALRSRSWVNRLFYRAAFPLNQVDTMSEDLWTSVDQSLDQLFDGSDSALESTLRSSDEADLPAIAVSPNLGRFLNLLVLISGSERVLEVGTLGGYSTIWLGRAVGDAGKVVSLEFDERHASVARENIDNAGLSDRVEIRLGAAAETMTSMVEAGEGPFDLIFLDADKESYPTYLELSMKLARPGTVIVADNVIRRGAVFDASETSPVLEGIRTFLGALSEDPRLTSAALQLVGSKGYDGISISRVGEG